MTYLQERNAALIPNLEEAWTEYEKAIKEGREIRGRNNSTGAAFVRRLSLDKDEVNDGDGGRFSCFRLSWPIVLYRPGAGSTLTR